jgi:hypothetical protein
MFSKGGGMIIKRSDKVYSMEISKTNIISQTFGGKVYCHMFLRLQNEVEVLPEKVNTSAIKFKEFHLETSRQRAFDLRNGLGITSLIYPVEGKFELEPTGDDYYFRTVPGMYTCYFSKWATTRRYIETSQLEEIRKYGDYPIEWESTRYVFGQCEPITNVKYQIRGTSIANIKKLLALIEDYVDVSSNIRMFLRVPISAIVATEYRVGCQRQRAYKLSVEDESEVKRIIRKYGMLERPIAVYPDRPEQVKVDYLTVMHGGEAFIAIKDDNLYCSVSENALEKPLLFELPQKYVADLLKF